MATWTETHGSTHVAVSADRATDGTWSAASNLVEVGSVGGVASLQIDATGYAVALVISVVPGVGVTTRALTKTPGGAWSAAEDLSHPGIDSSYNALALNAQGDAIVVMTPRTGDYADYVEARVLPRGGAWSSPVVLSLGSVWPIEPSVAIDATGEAVVVWMDGMRNNKIEAVTSPAPAIAPPPIVRMPAFTG